MRKNVVKGIVRMITPLTELVRTIGNSEMVKGHGEVVYRIVEDNVLRFKAKKTGWVICITKVPSYVLDDEGCLEALTYYVLKHFDELTNYIGDDDDTLYMSYRGILEHCMFANY
jgi:hypothetical protein